MGYKTVYKDVMRSYEASRSKAAAMLDERRAAIYHSFPKIAEIDQQLTAIGISLAKLALAKDQQALQAARANADMLRQEKAAILAANSVPEDYLTAAYICKACSDTGYTPPEPGKLPQRCSCLKQKLVEAYYSLSNVRGILDEENFDTFDSRCFSPNVIASEGISPLTNMKAIYHVATDFVQDFSTKFDNLLLYGRTGLGKTFICHCIAKDLLDAGHTVLYLTAPRLFKIIEDYRFNRESLNEPDEMLDAVADVDLLILDDLGAEFVTVVTSSALFDIINQRLLSRKPMIISSNLSPHELENHYSERIVSRFSGYYRMIKFFGEDIRTNKMYGGRNDT
ncbi:MAG: ATP-binding protein [Defluviitaleaceae bacterium]|nr:ATP-binding protein [Defluviitaleaceae bacterium]